MKEMNGNLLVSIIIIFLNTDKFIQEAIESVISQTYENWELLLVDDGSTDSSTAIAQKFANKYSDKVHYLEHDNHQNLGKSTSRNLGISKAKGEYLAFLDADDVFLPFKLEKQITILESHPDAAMVYGKTLYWHSWTGNVKDSQRDYIQELGIPTNKLFQPPSLLKILLGVGAGTVPCICSFLVKRQVVEDIGGFEETIQQLYEDQVFLAKIFLNSPVFVESGCWEKYRQRNDSSWHLSIDTGEDYHARLIFFKWLESYWDEQGFKNTELWQILQEKLWNYRYPNLYKLKKIVKHFRWRIKSLGKSIA